MKEDDEDKWKAHLQKERDRDRNRRQKMKEKLLTDPKLIEEAREKARLRKQKSREMKKLSGISPNDAEVTSTLGSYKRPQSLGKAVNRVKRLLPCSPSKKKAVVKRLIDETFGPSISNKLDLPLSKPHYEISEEVQNLVIEFYHKDSISRQAPGKRDCKSMRDPKTKLKEKRQIRHLTMTISEVYQQFKLEHPDAKIGKTKFYDLRPQNILYVSCVPHNVCVCKYHLNFSYLLEAVSKDLPEVPSDHKILLEKIVCDHNKELCMYNTCPNCKDKNINNVVMNGFNPNKPITYNAWETTGGVPTKVQTISTVGAALHSINEQLPPFKTHFYVKRVQADHFDNTKKSALPGLATIQVDYAENYTVLQQDEIQSAHWTHDRVTIFTCCVWIENSKLSYCVISDDHDHSKFSTWKFLKAIIDDVKDMYPNLSHINFFSDNCAAQFKSRFTISNLCFIAEDYGIVSATWNFFAASHGKGAVDGVGGTIKRVVWDAVRSRRFHVVSAESFYTCALSQCKGIKCLYVPKTDVAAIEDMLTRRWLTLLPIVGIQAHHFFSHCDDEFIVIGKTAKSSVEKRRVFGEEMEQFGKLNVDDVYTDSEQEDEPDFDAEQRVDTTKIKPGVFLLVSLTSEKKKLKQKYLAICQSEVSVADDVKVTFLKPYGKSNNQFIIDGNKDYDIPLTEILCAMPNPEMEKTGSRLVYKFKKNILF